LALVIASNEIVYSSANNICGQLCYLRWWRKWVISSAELLTSHCKASYWRASLASFLKCADSREKRKTLRDKIVLSQAFVSELHIGYYAWYA